MKDRSSPPRRLKDGDIAKGFQIDAGVESQLGKKGRV